MKHLALIGITCLLLNCCVEAAFKDFVVGPDSKEQVHNNDLAFGCEAEQEKELIALEDVMQDGMTDVQQMLNVLMQHAQRLGLTLDQLAQVHLMEEADTYSSEVGCDEPHSYNEQPSWYDVFFN